VGLILGAPIFYAVGKAVGAQEELDRLLGMIRIVGREEEDLRS